MATDKESQEISRRSFLKRTAIGGAGLVVATDILDPDLLAAGKPKSVNSTMIGVPFDARERVRLGIIGVGGRGTSLLRDLLAVENVEVKAICDLVPEKVARAQANRWVRLKTRGRSLVTSPCCRGKPPVQDCRPRTESIADRMSVVP